MTEDRAEEALREALARRADVVEPVAITVPRRRRRWPVVVAAAASIAVIAALGAGLARGGGHDAAPPPTSTASATDTTSAAVRTVGLGAVLVDVPASWKDGYDPDPGGWCVSAGGGARSRAPYVGNGNNTSLAVGCPNPTGVPEGFPQVPLRLYAPHLDIAPLDTSSSSVADGTTTYSGWTLTRRTVDGIVVSLLTDSSTAHEVAPIMGSIRTAAQDPNGCDTASPIAATGFPSPPPADVAAPGRVTSVVVCLYGRGDYALPSLQGSRVLTGQAGRAEVAAIDSAPAGGGPDRPADCAPDDPGDQAVVLRVHTAGGTVRDLYVYASSCTGNGIDDGVTKRALTVDDCGPLWGGRVQQYSGPSAVFRLCHPDS